MEEQEIGSDPAGEPEPESPAVSNQAGIDLPILTILVALAGLGFGFWAMISYTQPPTLVLQAPPPASAAPAAPGDHAPTPPAEPAAGNADEYLNLSLALYRQKRFEESISAAHKAINVRPDYAEAWNNLAAASAELGRWRDAIQAASEAVRLKPDFELAKNNLAWARAHEESAQGK